MKTTLFFLAALCSFSMFAQTNVSGGIYQNTTWFDGSQLVIENTSPASYKVMNALGMQVSEHRLGNGQTRLSLNVPSGIYMIQGSNGKTVKVFIGN
ncbi:MAG: T9SS C-terminal target domain-containing protein [Flavobacteriia bacterium]|nr:T9SS C-terminal target domain-containing protein [Flavobacteriia bacterium]